MFKENKYLKITFNLIFFPSESTYMSANLKYLKKSVKFQRTKHSILRRRQNKRLLDLF